MREDIRRFAKASCTLDGIYWYIAKKSGIKENLFWLLYALNDDEPHTQKQICEDWQFPKTTINTLIKECESAGYIKLEKVPGRKRELAIALTESGKAFAQKSLELIDEIEELAITEALERCAPTFIDDFVKFTAIFQRIAEEQINPERN